MSNWFRFLPKELPLTDLNTISADYMEVKILFKKMCLKLKHFGKQNFKNKLNVTIFWH
jgi:hypothetical protein